MINDRLSNKEISCGLCVVGGGISGICASIAAAREGVSVVLVHDRPVLGGNASSEIRMSIGGARDMRWREGGLMEEIFLENAAHNPYCRYPLWDIVLYDMIMREPNIKLLLNCSCADAECSDGMIRNVSCWMMPSQTWYKINAAQFIDCSGDSILAPLSGAHYTRGRESAGEYGEKNAVEAADANTMGNSIMMQLERTGCPESFTEPDWAEHFTPDSPELKHPTRDHGFGEGFSTNFWWLERGGTKDTIADADEIRHSLLALALGVYGHLKSSHGAECSNLTLGWLGALPGKRESRRYKGRYTLTAEDIAANRKFSDTVAYGGWPMDNHDPSGFDSEGPGNVCYPVLIPYSIPLRCLYSENVANLWFAGRNISVSHEALTSTRVSATCALLGQAAGTAAAYAVSHGELPGTLDEAMSEAIRRRLLLCDCTLPDTSISHGSVMRGIMVSGEGENPEFAARGLIRDIGEGAWKAAAGDSVSYMFPEKRFVSTAELYFDSDFERKTCTDRPEMAGSIMNVHSPVEPYRMSLPRTLADSFEVTTPEGFRYVCSGNIRRHVSVRLNAAASGVTFRLLKTTGEKTIAIYGVELT